jgi:hypothetical protein
MSAAAAFDGAAREERSALLTYKLNGSQLLRR